MRSRKLVTISLPPPLLKEAEKVAKEEYRNMSELFREALRFYIETREVRREAAQDGLFELFASARERCRQRLRPADIPHPLPLRPLT